MSFIERIFGGRNEVPTPMNNQSSSAKEEIEETKPSVEVPAIMTNPVNVRRVIDVMSNKPIDAAYIYIRTDYYNRGYNDAIILADVQFMQKGIDKIKNELRVLFQQIRLKYEDAARECENKIKLYETLFMSTSQQGEQSRLALIKSHLAVLDKMGNDLDSGAPSMQNMIDTYTRGFMTGIMAKNGVVNTPLTAPLASSTPDNQTPTSFTTIG